MDWQNQESRPGSFSKNFGWGAADGLGLLHQSINAIFESGFEPVPRDEARATIAGIAGGDPLVPLNFFLYHQVIDGISCVVADQLVVEALARDHDKSFDYLGMCALNFSRVGFWAGARPFQSHPSPWARGFIVDEVWTGRTWDVAKFDADHIEAYLEKNMIYGSERPRKFATNLNYLYGHSGLVNLSSSEREDWWAGAIFLFLDRCMMGGEIQTTSSQEDILQFLIDEDVWALTAANPDNAPFAAQPIISEYLEIGGVARLGAEARPARSRPANARRPISQQQRRALAQAKKPDDLSLNAVQRTFAQAQRQIRNRQHAAWVKQLYSDRCAICGNALVVDLQGTTYSEAGHVKPVGAPFAGPDHYSNILPFCPNHHKAFDRGGVWVDTRGDQPIIRSCTGDISFDEHPLELMNEHEFRLDYLEWHAKYFGHF